MANANNKVRNHDNYLAFTPRHTQYSILIGGSEGPKSPHIATSCTFERFLICVFVVKNAKNGIEDEFQS